MMARPLPDDPDARGEDFRRYASHALGAVILYARSAQDMATLGDDEALEHHIEGAEGALRLARDVANDLRKAKLLALARRAKAIRQPQEEGAPA